MTTLWAVLLIVFAGLDFVSANQLKCTPSTRQEIISQLESLQDDFLNKDQHLFIQVELAKFKLETLTRGLSQEEISTKVSFKLYTKSSRNDSILLEPTNASVIASSFDISKPTRFITHGFWSSGDSDTSQSIKDAYLGFQDVNVILVDWAGSAATYNYISAALNTVPIGQYTAKMVDALVAAGAEPKDIHLVGHSLGAHISGFAAKNAKRQVARITGLDPAGPLFETPALIGDHLSVGQAKFVDIIHTSAGSLGFMEPIGDADFYPNGGNAPQPGCESIANYLLGHIANMIDACSHGRSWQYFGDSINPREVYVASTKPGLSSEAYYQAPKLMGEYVDTKGRGVFYLRTNSRPPYALDGV